MILVDLGFPKLPEFTYVVRDSVIVPIDGIDG
jgi:hypothetical protein